LTTMPAVHVLQWEPCAATVVRVHPVTAVATYHHSAGVPPAMHGVPAQGHAAVPSRQSPGPRVLVNNSSTRMNEVASSGNIGQGTTASEHGVAEQQPQTPHEPIEAKPRKQVRRKSVSKGDPQTSLPSAWAEAFDLNADDPLLGGGAFAKILRVVECSTGEAYAMKVMNRPNFTMRGIESQIEAEIEAMRRCSAHKRCQHIVRLCDVAEENDYVYIRLEICTCDLLCFAKSQKDNRITMKDAWVWTQQLLKGLKDLHSLGILHRDIKPENLLCTSNGLLKIADFGWCAQVCDKPCSLAGTFQYMAPEVLGGHGVQTDAVDVWSAGVTVLQLLTGRQLLITYLGPGSTSLTLTDPHQALKVKTSRLLAEIEDRCPPPDEARPDHISWRCWDLLRWMLIPEVVLRASVSEALSHPWLQEAPSSKQADSTTQPLPDVRTKEDAGAANSCIAGSANAPTMREEEETTTRPALLTRSPRPSSCRRLSPPAKRAHEPSENAGSRPQAERTPTNSPRRVPGGSVSPRPHAGTVQAPAASPGPCHAASPVACVATSPGPQLSGSPLTRNATSPLIRTSTSPMTGLAASPLDCPLGSPAPCHVVKLSTSRTVYRLRTGDNRNSLADSMTTRERADKLQIRSCSQRASTELLGGSKRSIRRASVAAGEDVRRKVDALGRGESLERITRPVTVRLRRRYEAQPSPGPHGHVTPARSVAGITRMPRTGSAMVPSATQKDALICTSPPDFLKASTPGSPPMPVGSENNPLDANKGVARVRHGDVLLRTNMVMHHQWPSAVKRPAHVAAPGQQRIHVASGPTIAECCRLSPRPYIPTYGARAPLMALLTPPPATPSPEAFRDVIMSRCTRSGPFASVAC